MPELPEVETVCQDLNQYVVGKKIKKVIIKPDFVKKITPNKKQFVDSVIGETVNHVGRRGKLLIIDLGPDKKILAHLKMTGQFVFRQSNNKIIPGGHPIEQHCDRPDRFNKVLFDFGSDGKLYFNDIRKFGYLKLVNAEQAMQAVAKFGYEPIDSEFSFKKFNEILNKKKNLAIKKILLMQDLIAGIGNIYADESCFATGIRCDRPAKTLSLAEKKVLYQKLKQIIKKAIKYRGTSVANYIDCMGKKGSYARFLKVYNRVGQLCKKCKKAKIKRIKLGGRGTSFCPICQK